MRGLLLALALLYATPAWAVVFSGRPSLLIGGGHNSHRVWTGCFIADQQNGDSQDDEIDNAVFGVVDPNALRSCRPIQNSLVPNNCAPPYCQKSPYCDTSWSHTADIKMTNLAHHLNGDDELVNWSTISGNDHVTSPSQGRLDHTCNAVISLGDMADINDPVVALNLPENQLEAAQVGANNQISLVKKFWSIITRVPGLPGRGNHDPNDPFINLMETTLNFTARSYYYSREPTRHLGYAILVPTSLGRPLCIINVNDNSISGISGQNSADRSWFSSTIGCGGGYPTIAVGHSMYAYTYGGAADVYTSAFASNIRAILDVNPKVIMVASGHQVLAGLIPESRKQLFTTGGGNTLFGLGCNWQEGNTHGTVVNYPYGNTPSDGAGMFYCVVQIDADAKTISSWDYSPYWGRHDRADNELQAITHEVVFPLDIDAR